MRFNEYAAALEGMLQRVAFRMGNCRSTPPVSEGALPGIRRAFLLETGRIREAVVTLADLAAAQAVCAGNALALRQVASIDGRKLPLLATPWHRFG